MSKSDQFKNSMKGGLNGLLSPTAPTKKDSSKKTIKSTSDTETKKPVHCNFVIEKSIHTRMKYLAIEKNMSLKEIVNEAMKEYLDKYEE